MKCCCGLSCVWDCVNAETDVADGADRSDAVSIVSGRFSDSAGSAVRWCGLLQPVTSRIMARVSGPMGSDGFDRAQLELVMSYRGRRQRASEHSGPGYPSPDRRKLGFFCPGIGDDRQ